MRFIRTTLATAALGVAVLATAGPAMADDRPAATPKPKPSAVASTRPSPEPVAPSALPRPSRRPSDTVPRPVGDVPRGAPETGGGPGGSALVPFGGTLLAAGAGMGVLVLRRRADTKA